MILLYVLHNKVNHKVYIGQTVQTVEERVRGHCWDARHGSKMAIHCAIRKYGLDAFDVVKLCTAVSQEQADRLEKVFILMTRAYEGRGYNMTYGGKAGWVCNDQSRANNKERWTPERRQHSRDVMKGRIFSAQHRSRISRSTSSRLKAEYATNPDRIRAFLEKGWHGLRTPLPGEKNGRAKITADQVREIRKLWAEPGHTSQEKIAKRYGITQMMVSRIVTRRSWKHVV